LMEAEFVQWLRDRLGSDTRIPLGLGDDAAVLLSGSNGGWVVTTDLVCDGVHFHLATTRPELVGRKALAVNLSDLAAMAATPYAAFVSLLLPQTADADLAHRLYDGLIELAQAYHVAVAGGDTNCWNGKLAINVALLGTLSPRGPLRRNGAVAGDAILVTGQLGGSLLERHLTFEPRVREALRLHEDYPLHAGMDLSDGLALDLSRLLAESQVGAEIEINSIPISQAARTLSQTSGRTPLQHALSDGEDFELLLTMAPDEADRLLRDQPLDVPITRIGTVVVERGQWQIDASRKRSPLPPEGYLHGPRDLNQETNRPWTPSSS